MDNSTLGSKIHHPSVEIFVLYVNGVPAGYGEFEKQAESEIELSYFGIIPDFIGCKLGPYLLNFLIEKAWSYPISRFWVHTCSLDHPKALSMYESSGFVKYKEDIEWSDDPWTLGLFHKDEYK